MLMNNLNIIEPEEENSKSKVISIAPGQYKRPIPSFAIENIDEFCFPEIYGGFPMDKEKTLTYFKRAKYEARNVDNRHRNPSRLLYMAKRITEEQIFAAVNIYLRKTNANKNLKVKDIRDRDKLAEIIQTNEGYVDYNFTKNIRHSPAFWQSKKKNLIAMIQQQGTPTIFMTLSISETKNPELLAVLHKNANMGNISPECAMNLDNATKTKLIKEDPVTIVRYFEHIISNILKIMKNEKSL